MAYTRTKILKVLIHDIRQPACAPYKLADGQYSYQPVYVKLPCHKLAVLTVFIIIVTMKFIMTP